MHDFHCYCLRFAPYLIMMPWPWWRGPGAPSVAPLTCFRLWTGEEAPFGKLTKGLVLEGWHPGSLTRQIRDCTPRRLEFSKG